MKIYHGSKDKYDDLLDTFIESKNTRNYKGVLTLYHSTLKKNLDNIRKDGLKNTTHSPKWYMLSTTKEDAIDHMGSKDQDPIIIKYEVPYDGQWKGFPYFWPPAIRSGDNSSSYTGDWYAIKEPLPKEFIKDVIYLNKKTESKFTKAFNQYLIEITSDISIIKDKINSLNINLDEHDDLRTINIDDVIKMEYEVMDDEIYIEHIEVQKEMRGSGLSKLLLQKFLKATDIKKLPVTLMVYPTDDVTEDQLVSIYKKFGFKVVGKDKGNKRPLMKREVS